jgi:hypothetical protein
MSELRERFRQDLAEVCWKDLRIHLPREVIITVAPELDLVAAATAIARDDKGRVEVWLAAGELAKPSSEQLAAWEQELAKPFRILIVQPYILAQEVTHA